MSLPLNQTSWLRLSGGNDSNELLSRLSQANTWQRRGDLRADPQGNDITRNSSRRSPTQDVWTLEEQRVLLQMENEFYNALEQGHHVNSQSNHSIDGWASRNSVVGDNYQVDTLMEDRLNAHRNHVPRVQQDYHSNHEQIPSTTSNGVSVQQIPPPPTTRLMYSLWLPFLVVLVPNVAFSGVLLALVYADKWKFNADTFLPNQDLDGKHDGYILVRMSPTRIAIVTSCAATLAPFLTFAIMSLWRFRTVRYVIQSPRTGVEHQVEVHRIPQINLLLSLLGGSIGALGRYIKKCCPERLSRRRDTDRGPVTGPVHLTALILLICILLVVSTWVADTVFHSLSNTVSVPEHSTPTSMNSFGCQLTDYCQTFNSTDNICLPCSWYVTGDPTEYWERTNKRFKIRMNISEELQVQTIEPGLAILLPTSRRIPNTTDYRATTFGLSTKCKTITNTCNPRFLNDQDIRTVFNCSEEFRGVNGQPPVLPMNTTFTILDPDTPPLVIKRSSYLQFGFFSDPNLSVPYNPVNFNVSVPGWATLFGAASDGPCPAGDQLLTTVYMGTAGRFSQLSSQAGVNLSQDSGLLSIDELAYDFMFGCEFSAFDVEYTWARGEVRSFTLTPSNSSLLTMYVGAMQYYQQAPTQEDAFYDVNTMALEGNSTAMADTWARLFSTRVLSIIGAYTDPRVNLAEQERKDVFIARIHIGSLIFIVSCGAAYVILVSALTISALCCLYHDDGRGEGVRAYVDQLSFEKQLEKHIALGQPRELEPSNAGRASTSSGQPSAESSPTPGSRLRPRSHRSHAPEITLTSPRAPPGFF